MAEEYMCLAPFKGITQTVLKVKLVAVVMKASDGLRTMTGWHPCTFTVSTLPLD